MNVQIPKDAPPYVLLQAKAGELLSNQVRFQTSDLEEVAVLKPNVSIEKAQRVNLGVVVNGVI